nr:phosphotransferase [Goekera deserti]
MTRAAESFTSVHRVDTGRAVYALRIGAALQIHAPGTLDAEAAWLHRPRDGGLPVPGVMPARDGELGARVTDDAGRPRECAVFDWVPGRSLRSRLTEPIAAALGRLAARLHADAQAWRAPPDVVVADRCCSGGCPHDWWSRTCPGRRCSPRRSTGRRPHWTSCGTRRRSRRTCCTVT